MKKQFTALETIALVCCVCFFTANSVFSAVGIGLIGFAALIFQGWKNSN